MAKTLLQDNCSFILPSVETMIKRWTFINHLTDGWEGIVENNKTKYLIQESKETKEAYDTRARQATYYDFFNTTIEGVKGLAFQKPIIQNDDIPSQISPLLEDMDTLGNNLDVVAKGIFDKGLRKGLVYAYVDMQKKVEEVTNQATESQMGIRPYVVVVEPENIINYTYETINGNTILTQVTIKQVVSKQVGRYTQEKVCQYRVFNIGKYEVYSEDMELIESGTTGLNQIPIVAFNLDDAGKFLEAMPPFYSLGKLNIRHYQIVSDSEWASHMANVPILKIIGLSKSEVDNIVISANQAIITPNPANEVDISWLDFEGKNIATNLEIAKRHEGQIALMGLSVISEATTEQTATESVIKAKQKQSKLNNWVLDLEDGLNKILYFMALYMNLEDGGTVKIDADILANMLTPEEMGKYSEMVAKGQLSYETMWSILKANKKLPSDFDEEVEKQRIETESLQSDNMNNNMSDNNFQG